jgi:hypothetical protein
MIMGGIVVLKGDLPGFDQTESVSEIERAPCRDQKHPSVVIGIAHLHVGP